MNMNLFLTLAIYALLVLIIAALRGCMDLDNSPHLKWWSRPMKLIKPMIGFMGLVMISTYVYDPTKDWPQQFLAEWSAWQRREFTPGSMPVVVLLGLAMSATACDVIYTLLQSSGKVKPLLQTSNVATA
jgi:hypothetical protein